MVWKKIKNKGKIPKEQGCEFDVDGKKIVVINQDKLYALDAVCIHQEQSITCGKIKDNTIECPHHFWHYNYKTGELLDYLTDISLETYKIEERDDGIYINI